MIDFTTIQTNPIPPPILELQKENSLLKGKNKMFEKVIFSAITAGVLVIIYYLIKDEKSRNNEEV